MRASAFDPPQIPASFWQRTDARTALRERDMGALFDLLNKHLKLSQTRIGTAVDLSQGHVGEVIHGTRRIAKLHVFQRIADGPGMPDDARLLLGVAPRAPRPGADAPAVAAQDSELLQQITAARSIDGTVIRVLQGETDTIHLSTGAWARQRSRASWKPTPVT